MSEVELRVVPADDPGDARCSFCGKERREVGVMVAGRTVLICDECTGLCADILAEEAEQPGSERPKTKEGRRRALEDLARQLARDCWDEQGLPRVLGHLAMALANALEPEHQGPARSDR